IWDICMIPLPMHASFTCDHFLMINAPLTVFPATLACRNVRSIYPFPNGWPKSAVNGPERIGKYRRMTEQRKSCTRTNGIFCPFAGKKTLFCKLQKKMYDFSAVLQ